MSTAISIPYQFCYRCGCQHRWFHHHCGEPGMRDVLGMGARMFKHDELVLGGAFLFMADLLDNSVLRSLGTYIAGRSMHKRFGITIDDIHAHFQGK